VAQQQEYRGSCNRRPEGIAAGIFKFQQQETRRYSSRNIQVPATGDQKVQQQEYSGSSNRRPEGTAAGILGFQQQETTCYRSRRSLQVTKQQI
jgi:hypothetical protein